MPSTKGEPIRRECSLKLSKIKSEIDGFGIAIRASIEVAAPVVYGPPNESVSVERGNQQIGAVILADRTLGGLCDWVEPEAPEPVDLPVEGGASLKAAIVPVLLHYATADPLG